MTGAAAEAVPTGNTFDKYGSQNAVVRRLMGRFRRDLDELWRQAAPGSVLDVGCGEGVLTHAWATRLGEGRIVGIDLPDDGLQTEWRTRARPNLEYRVSEATALAFGDDEFDLASAIEVLEHVPDPEARAALAAPRRGGAARAALARAQPRPGGLRARPRQHAGSPEPLVSAGVRAPPVPPRAGRGGPHAQPVDHGARRA